VIKKIAAADIFSIVALKYRQFALISNDRVVVSLTEDQVKRTNDSGLTILYELSNSDKNYLYEVAKKTE